MNVQFDFSSVERVTLKVVIDLDFDLFASETHAMNCYIKSLAAVPSGSRLKSVEFNFYTTLQPPDSDSALLYSWEQLDATLSGDHLELEKLNFNVYYGASSVLATDYSHETKPGTTARTKRESVHICKTRLGQVYKQDRN